MISPTSVNKVFTDLTCWKCEEESLIAAPATQAARGSLGELVQSTAVQHSVCQKCGALSVNPLQSRANKMLWRKQRKEAIREANRSSN